jgi:hypothetical protein
MRRSRRCTKKARGFTRTDAERLIIEIGKTATRMSAGGVHVAAGLDATHVARTRRGLTRDLLFVRALRTAGWRASYRDAVGITVLRTARDVCSPGSLDALPHGLCVAVAWCSCTLPDQLVRGGFAHEDLLYLRRGGIGPKRYAAVVASAHRAWQTWYKEIVLPVMSEVVAGPLEAAVMAAAGVNLGAGSGARRTRRVRDLLRARGFGLDDGDVVATLFALPRPWPDRLMSYDARGQAMMDPYRTRDVIERACSEEPPDPGVALPRIHSRPRNRMTGGSTPWGLPAPQASPPAGSSARAPARPPISITCRDEEGEGPAEVEDPTTRDPASHLDAHQLLERLSALDRLIVLASVGGDTDAEIGRRLGMTRQAVWSRRTAALDTLRRGA